MICFSSIRSRFSSLNNISSIRIASRCLAAPSRTHVPRAREHTIQTQLSAILTFPASARHSQFSRALQKQIHWPFLYPCKRSAIRSYQGALTEQRAAAAEEMRMRAVFQPLSSVTSDSRWRRWSYLGAITASGCRADDRKYDEHYEWNKPDDLFEKKVISVLSALWEFSYTNWNKTNKKQEQIVIATEVLIRAVTDTVCWITQKRFAIQTQNKTKQKTDIVTELLIRGLTENAHGITWKRLSH